MTVRGNSIDFDSSDMGRKQKKKKVLILMNAPAVIKYPAAFPKNNVIQ